MLIQKNITPVENEICAHCDAMDSIKKVELGTNEWVIGIATTWVPFDEYYYCDNCGLMFKLI